MGDELWKVINVVDTTMFIPGQGAVPAKKISFSTATGAKSTIDVPDSEFEPGNVANLIHEAASKIIDVQGLVGPSMSGVVGSIDYNAANYPNG